MRRILSSLLLALLAAGLSTTRADETPGAAGFTSLFNGKDLTGWEGLDGFWSVKDGVIDGSETKEKSVQTDLILTDSKDHPDKYTNFELHLKWQMVSPAGNSGVQFRSVINNPQTLHAGGYQADIDSGSVHTGSIYDESGVAGGRKTMSNRGEKTTWDSQNERHATPLPETDADLKALLHSTGDWNEIVLKVQGNHYQYTINGHLMTDLTDESPKAVLKGGVIALQMHAGFTMDIQFKDISIEFLEAQP